MQIERLDHQVITVEDIEASCVFYTRQPVPRKGEAGHFKPVHFRDPDGNLSETFNIQ